MPERLGLGYDELAARDPRLIYHNIVPYGPYRAADGRLVNLAVASQEHWVVFCRDVLRRPDRLEDSRFADVISRRVNRAVLEPIVEAAIGAAGSDEWFARLQSAVPTVESALRMSRSPVAGGSPPCLGGDTVAVLRDAGYSDGEVERLIEEKVAWPAA